MVYINEINSRIKDLESFNSSGYSVLDNAALKTVKERLFEPGMKGNRKEAMG